MNDDMNRRDFLRGIFRPLSQAAASDEQPNEEDKVFEADYRAMLPPDFTPSLLRMEAERLGGDTAHMTENAMAELVYNALRGSGTLSIQRQ